MTHVAPAKAVVNTNQSTNNNQTPLNVVLYNSDGTAAGTVKKQAAQANSTAEDVPALVTDFNALLVKLRAAGVISA